MVFLENIYFCRVFVKKGWVRRKRFLTACGELVVWAVKAR